MANVNYTVVLDLTDNGCIQTGWRLKQGDSGNSTIIAKVVNNGVDAYDPNVTPEIAFKRADGNSVLSTMTASDGYYNYTFVGNELAVAGPVVMDVTFTDEEARTSTASCKFEVVPDPAGYDPEGAHTYDNPVSVLVEEAKQDASDAEAWSSGTRNGEPVSSGDPTYHNNSKYWSEQANPTLLQNLQDVVLNSPTEGQALIYDATNEVWKNGNGGGSGSSTLSGLTDVNIESPISGEALIYDFLNQEWINGQAGVTNLNGLTDVVITTPSNNQVLKYDSVSSKWINATGGGGGGLLPHLYIDSEAGSTVTVVAPDSSVITPTQISSGHWECDVPSYGVYTIHAVLNGDDAVLSLTVDDVKEYHVTDSHYSYTLNVYAPTGSTIRVTATGETYTGTGAGSTAVVFALHQASTTYTITVTYDGLDSSTTITSSATTGGSGSKTIEFGTINLTVDEDLIGETIVMTKGTDTVSKVASSTSMVFYPNATGNWTISCQYDGETYYSEPNPVVVSSLSTAVSAEISLVHIPEGATVTPTDDIQTWLACANITDKSYTTLAEVLADRETFEILISDSNACDYMARSTTWADDVADDADAMALIGKYDYCSTALLGNSTWASAIGNSDYFEEVLNVSVPKMTSNTTPSGVVSANSVSANPSHPAWYAFDQTTKTSTTEHGWSTDGTTNVPAWLRYEFTSAVIINSVVIRPYNNATANCKNFKIQASNDGFASDINDLYTGQFDNNATTSKPYITISFENNTAYKYYRVYIIDTWGTAWAGLSYVQFYGRKSVQATNTNGIIHTANGDTVTCNGNTYVADTNGIIEIDFSDFDEGTYTFTSGIAKDPTNLSNYYSKSFKITKSPYGGTTELYLMPDAVKTLYWWGYESDNLEDCSTANGWVVGYTNYGFNAPTHNTNHISVPSNSNNNTCAIGNKNSINGTTVKGISKGITAVNNVYCQLGTGPNKTLSQMANYQDTSSSSIELSSVNLTGQSYVYFGTGAQKNADIYALWYE